jgi:hypothetical protein
MPRRVSSARSAVSYAFLIAWVASRLADETILKGCRRVVDVAIGERLLSNCVLGVVRRDVWSAFVAFICIRWGDRQHGLM